MSTLLGFDSLPGEIRAQLDAVTRLWRDRLGPELTGVYLHGSIALNAFNPASGDLDLLAVVERPLTVEEKLALAEGIIRLDGKPRPVEMSAVTLADARNWKNPGSCVFHYSDYWTERYLRRLADPAQPLYVVDREFPDADVTGYIRLLKERGIVLYGRPAAEVFADVPDEDFFASISADVEDYDFHAYEPRYLASNILILGRILSFRAEKRILSKYEAGLWMIAHMPEDLKYLPEGAMRIWFEGGEAELPEEDLERLRRCLIGEILKQEE